MDAYIFVLSEWTPEWNPEQFCFESEWNPETEWNPEWNPDTFEWNLEWNPEWNLSGILELSGILSGILNTFEWNPEWNP